MEYQQSILCDFCGMHLKETEENINMMVKHEEICAFNPNSRQCVTCEKYDYDVTGCEWCNDGHNVRAILSNGWKCDNWKGNSDPVTKINADSWCRIRNI